MSDLLGSPQPDTTASERRCVKCGGEDLYVVFHGKGCTWPGCTRCAECLNHSHAKEHREHLHVTCRGCQFDWIEPTLEQAKKTRILAAMKESRDR